jgi:hypothetical protein
MKTKITLADGLTVSAVEFATEVSTNIGNRGGGKSNGAAVVVEQELEAGVPVVVLDYVGIWYSLRLSRDGKAPSKFSIPVLGGRHGDVALAATAGAVVAEALADRNSSAIIDLSFLSKGDRCRFATDFAEAFFAAKKRNPGPVLLVLEEAQRYIPQRVMPDQARMLGAFEEIAETGRNFGIGMMLISLRPQKLNKDVLNLSDWVFAYRTNGVHERKALSEWVQEKGADGRSEMAGELPGLPRGTAIVWCPVRRIYGRYQIPLKQTYDASATPTSAKASVEIKPLDLGELETAMGKAVEDAKANDPRALKAEIASLRKQLAAKPSGPANERRVEVPVDPAEWRASLKEALQRMRSIEENLGAAVPSAKQAVKALESCQGALPSMPERRVFAPVPVARPATAQRLRPAIAGKDGDVPSGGLRRMLIALAQRPKGLTNAQVGVRAGLSSKSGTFATYLGRARSQGWIADDGTTRIITEAGLDALGSFDPLPEGQELAAYWINELGGGASRMLQALVDAYPNELTNAEIGERAGISSGSGTFATYMGRMRSLELIAGRGQVRAAAELFG